MKKLLLLGLFLILSANIIQAQLRLNTYAIGTFSDNVESYYSSSNYFKGRVDGGFMWGGGLEYMLHKYNGIECFYQRMDTHAPMTYIGGNFGSVKRSCCARRQAGSARRLYAHVCECFNDSFAAFYPAIKQSNQQQLQLCCR